VDQARQQQQQQQLALQDGHASHVPVEAELEAPDMPGPDDEYLSDEPRNLSRDEASDVGTSNFGTVLDALVSAIAVTSREFQSEGLDGDVTQLVNELAARVRPLLQDTFTRPPSSEHLPNETDRTVVHQRQQRFGTPNTMPTRTRKRKKKHDHQLSGEDRQRFFASVPQLAAERNTQVHHVSLLLSPAELAFLLKRRGSSPITRNPKKKDGTTWRVQRLAERSPPKRSLVTGVRVMEVVPDAAEGIAFDNVFIRGSSTVINNPSKQQVDVILLS
jgi:hypothetical protein